MLRFYTVDCDKRGYPVKYIDPDTLKVKTFSGPFDDPGEASQEFQACVGGSDCCYLEPAALKAKAQALALAAKKHGGAD